VGKRVNAAQLLGVCKTEGWVFKTPSSLRLRGVNTLNIIRNSLMRRESNPLNVIS